MKKTLSLLACLAFVLCFTINVFAETATSSTSSATTSSTTSSVSAKKTLLNFKTKTSIKITEGSFSEKETLKVEKITTGSAFDDLQAKLKSDGKLLGIYKMQLFDGVKLVTKDQKCTVVIPVKAIDFRTSHFKGYFIDENGNQTEIKTLEFRKMKDTTIQLEMSVKKLGTFAIIDANGRIAERTESSLTNLVIKIVFGVMVLLLLVQFIIFVFIRRKPNKLATQQPTI